MKILMTHILEAITKSTNDSNTNDDCNYTNNYYGDQVCLLKKN